MIFIFSGGPLKLASRAADDEACHNVCNMRDAAVKKIIRHRDNHLRYNQNPFRIMVEA